MPQGPIFTHTDIAKSQLFFLQSLVKYRLLSEFGLPGLRRILLSWNSHGTSGTLILPNIVRDQMLTFLCEDFEEVCEQGKIKRKVSWLAGAHNICLEYYP